MQILLHTIALEPARDLPQCVARPLVELLPAIAGAGFPKLEIYEPHLMLAPDERALRDAFAEFHLTPVVLSAGLDLTADRATEEAWTVQAHGLFARVDAYGFQKVRLSPGRTLPADDSRAAFDAVAALAAERLCWLAERRPQVEWLLDTHPGSLAEQPALFARWVREIERPNVGLVWRPTVWDADAARAQFAVQAPYVRLFHLLNRAASDLTEFSALRDGVIPWREFLEATQPGVDVSIAFVPSSVPDPERFDMTAALQEAVAEFQYLVELASA